MDSKLPAQVFINSKIHHQQICQKENLMSLCFALEVCPKMFSGKYDKLLKDTYFRCIFQDFVILQSHLDHQRPILRSVQNIITYLSVDVAKFVRFFDIYLDQSKCTIMPKRNNFLVPFCLLMNCFVISMSRATVKVV